MKKFFVTIFLLSAILCVHAKHIKGGFFNYQYLGPGISNPSNLRYKITLTIYMLCEATVQQVDDEVPFTFFNGSSSSQFANVNVAKTSEYLLTKLYDDPCITGDQSICFYKIVTYVLDSYELPPAVNGYTISYQRCCRIPQMDNIVGSENIGNTYTIQLPGTSSKVPDAVKNSSPSFPINDTVVICQQTFFQYNFSATDPDGDSLTYAFCTSYNGGGQSNPTPAAASPPPYSSVPYSSGYNGSIPLGTGVTINAITGVISGVAPAYIEQDPPENEYAVTVCVSEYRKGVYLGQARKELHFRIQDCSVIKAHLNPIPTSCDGFSVTFTNAVTNPSGTDYLWTFGEPLSGAANTSTDPSPTHTYGDTGVYTLKLRVSLSGQCADSTTAPVKVYPGFFPGFRADAPLCKGSPVQFTDTTTAKYGTVTGWRWNFGDLTGIGDTSLAKNPTYSYPDSGTFNVQLIVGSTYGCVDTVLSLVHINNSPTINLVPHDTLICNIDTLQIRTNNTGNFSWSPNYNISSLTSANPLVSPKIPTTYYVTFTDQLGCSNNDSVVVNVVSRVTLGAGNDTTICRTDGLLVNTSGDALHYVWTPAIYLDSDTARQPFANPLVDVITYHVVGSIGKCSSTADVTIKTLPYPIAYAGADTTVCFGKSVPLLATGGNAYQWSPATFLSATNIPNPTAVNPTATTQYIVAVKAPTGCPKAAFDTIIVNVDPLVVANAGPQDTTAVLGEPLHLTGTGGATYLWTPATWLSDPTIADPVAFPEDNITYNLLVTSVAGCQKTDTIHIKLYKVPPSFYVPSAFTPNNDNNNDILKPILLGMRTLNYFRVYDRWGKLMFFTDQKGEGWDGTFKGNPQDPGTYVWMAAGETYTNELIVRKGYVVLVR